MTPYKALGVASDERVRELAAAVLAGDAKTALDLAAAGTADGVQLGDWVEQSLDYFRDLMVLTVDPEAPLVASSPKRRGELVKQCEGVPTERLLELMDLLGVVPSADEVEPLRSNAVRDDARPHVQIGRLRRRRSGTAGNARTAHRPGEPDSAAAASDLFVASDFAPRGAADACSDDGKKNAPTQTPMMPPPAEVVNEAMTVDGDNWRRFWHAFLEELNTTDQVLAGMLHESERIECPSPNQLTVYVPGTIFGTCKTYAEHAKTRLDAAARRAAGRPVVLRFEIGTPAPTVVAPTDSPTKLRDEAARDPWVRQAEQLFGAKIISVDRVSAASVPAAVVAPVIDTMLEQEDDS